MAVENSQGQTAPAEGASSQVTAPPAGASAAPPSGAQAPGTGAQGAVTPPPFTLNSKFNFMDAKGAKAEAEFDEWIRGAIKDPDTEKKARELYEKAHGIEFVKSERKRYMDDFNATNSKLHEATTRAERLDGFLSSGNLAAFQRETNLPDSAILIRARQILDMMKNPELKAKEDQEYSQTSQMGQLQTQNQQLLQQVGQARLFELNTVLDRPDVAQIVSNYDAKVGKPGAFRTEVINRGLMYHEVYKVDKSPNDIVAEMLGFMGVAQPQTQNGVAQPPVQTPPEANGQQVVTSEGVRVLPPKKPTVPNISGKGTSPVKKAWGSFDEIREHGRKLAQQG